MQLIEYYDQESQSYDDESLIRSLRIAIANDHSCGNYFKNFLYQTNKDKVTVVLSSFLEKRSIIYNLKLLSKIK